MKYSCNTRSDSVITVYLYYFIGMYIVIVLSYSDSYLYWCLVYIYKGNSALHIYITVTSPYPWDRGVTGWHQSLGSHLFSTTNRQINVILICTWSAWIITIHSNYKYRVFFSFLVVLLLNSDTLPSSHFQFPRMIIFLLSLFFFHVIPISFVFIFPLSKFWRWNFCDVGRM